MNYRKATLEDVAQVAVLFRALAFHIKHASKDPYWDFEEMPLDMTEQVVRGYIENEESCVLVAEADDDITGMMMLEVIPCHMVLSSHQKVGYIAAGYVKEEYRRQGIMKELEKLSNDFFRSIGIKYVEVCYLPENDGAKEAWNSMGYQCFREQARKCVDDVKYAFVYGTLMKNHRNHGYLNDSTYIGDGVIDGYQMYDLGTYPGIVEGEGSVLGEVYQITEETEKRLDYLEEEGSLYLKKSVTVRLNDNQSILALVYVYNKDVSGFEKVEGKYA